MLRPEKSFHGYGWVLLLGLVAVHVCAAGRPNVLFIAVDDLRPELGCYGHPLVKSPNIDALAAGGLLFERAYCQQAVCAPSRISLLTGMRPDSTGVHDLNHPLRKTTPEALSMPEHFKDNGYETVSLGKIYHHHGDDNGVGWSSPAWHPGKDGAWKGRGYLTPGAHAQIKNVGKRTGVGPAYEAADVDDDAYPDGHTAKRAIAELRRLKRGDGPFFLAVGFVKPHLPFNAPKRYWDLYPEKAVKLSNQTAWPKEMPEFASNGDGCSWEINAYAGVEKQRPFSAELSKSLIRGYYACVSYTDALVGKVLGELDRLGLRDDTVIILWGDHGWKLSEYSAWCKHTNFEVDTQVPMILAVPGKQGGQRTAALSEFVDIFPTLCDLCGLDVPSSCEGTSMAPLLDRPDRPWKQAAFSQYPRGNRMGYSMRTKRWRYTEWVNRKSGEVEARELYDHAESPVASENLASKAELADEVRRLSALLAKGQGWKKLQRGKAQSLK